MNQMASLNDQHDFEPLHWRAKSYIRTRLRDIVRSSLKPPPRLNLVEWADTKRRLPDNSAEPGQWETSRVEVAREPMLSISNPEVQEITVMCCIQLMKTELMLNAALYYIDQEPSPIMYVAPKEGLAEAWSKERFTKSVKAIPHIAEIFSNNRRGDGNTILQKQFPGGQLSIVSARNPDDLAMRACRIMLFDEIDKYPLNVGAGEGGAGGEGDPIAVAWGRATTYGRRAKKITACSPTVEGRSRIEQEYLKSDQREFYQRCPHCNHAEVMDWDKHVDIPKDKHGRYLPNEAVIRCRECATVWSEGDRHKSIRNGFWRAKYPERKHHHGYRVSAFASPFTPLVMLAHEWVGAIDNPEQMKAFINTRMAKTWREVGEAPDWERLYERREPGMIGKVPDWALMITAGIDVQKDYLIYEVVAWGRKKRNFSIDIGVIEGKISEDATKEQLSNFLETRYKNAHGVDMPIELALIDSSNDTAEVYAAVASIGTPRLRAIKGVDSLNTYYGTPKPVTLNINGERRAAGIKMWPVGVSVIKEQFYKWLMLRRPTDEQLAEGAQWPTGYCHFPEWDEDYFKQITAEILVERKDNKGFVKSVWERVRDHNHYLDCRVYARAGAAMLGIDRMGQDDEAWIEREKRYGKPENNDAEAEEVITIAQPAAPLHPTTKKKRPANWFKRR